jgi:hypothetical protein
MAEIEAKIVEIEAEIKAIKDANPHWASDAGDKAAITAMNNRIVALGKFPIFTLHFNI